MTRTKTRWGCFFPDLTQLASSSSTTNLPLSYCRFKMKNQAKKQEIWHEQRRIFSLHLKFYTMSNKDNGNLSIFIGGMHPINLHEENVCFV